jgi:hypothetical protein
MESFDESDTAFVQTFGKSQIPQGACPIQRNCHQIGADLAEFRFRGGRSELAHTYVLRDIEVGIIEPCRWGLTERARAGSLPRGKGLRSGHNRLPPGTDVWANDTGRIFGLLAVRHRRGESRAG